MKKLILSLLFIAPLAALGVSIWAVARQKTPSSTASSPIVRVFEAASGIDMTSAAQESVEDYLYSHAGLVDKLYSPCVDRIKALKTPDPHKWEFDGKYKYIDTPEGMVCLGVFTVVAFRDSQRPGGNQKQ